MPTRRDIAQSTAAKLRAAATSLSSRRATIGVDGFVDEIISVVDKRLSLEKYDPIRTIEALGRKISASAGQSNNFELVVKRLKLGGNGPIMANVLAAAGMKITYVGCLGHPAIHPVFEELSRRAEVFSIAEPGHTDALEFEDGKLMLGKHGTLREVTWDNVVARVGVERLTAAMAGSSLIGMVNWTMLPYLNDIWQNLSEHVLPKLPKPKTGRRLFFVDLCDPEKRTHDDQRAMLSLLTRMQSQIDMTLGLNLKEAAQIADVLGLPKTGSSETGIEQAARSIREKLGLYCVMVHPRKGAAAATSDGESANFVGPFVKEPKISTGAGDHFNAGFCLGQVLGMTLEESLCTGVATSGYYVRSAISPNNAQLAEFVENLPDPE